AENSWLRSPDRRGDTTRGVRWDTRWPGGTSSPGHMTSFSHYALGAIADWLHRTVAGLAPAAPGYRRILVNPHPLDGFDHASAEHLTPYGRAAVRWERTADGIEVTATIPANTDAEVVLSDGT